MGSWESCTVCGVRVDTVIDSGYRDPMGGLWVCGSCLREPAADAVRREARRAAEAGRVGSRRRCLACGGTMSAAYTGNRCGMCGRGPMVDLDGEHVNRMSGPGSDPATGGRCPDCQGTSGSLETPCPRCFPAETYGVHMAVLAALQEEYNAEAVARHRRITEVLG